MKCPIQIFNFSIKNASSDAVDIHIDGDIVDAGTQELLKAWLGDETSVSFKSFRNQINAVEATTYNVYINSMGGIVTDAMAIHDFLNELESKGKTVNRIGRGLIASAATYLLVGNNSSITKNSWFMIHNVSGGIWGDVNMIENYATTLRKFNNRTRDFYAEATGQRKEDVTKMMNAETWMTADEAVAKGFVKNVIGAADFTNQISKDNWQYSDMSVLNAYNAAVKAPTEITTSPKNFDDMKEFLQKLGADIMNAIKGVKAPENNDHGALMNSIAEAINKPFESAGEQMETVVNAAVAAKVVNVDFAAEGPAKAAMDAAVATAVTNATKDFGTKITALEAENVSLKQTNEALTADITLLKGNKQTSNSGEKPVKVVGSFN